MPTVMITGVNRGLGLEFLKQYAAHGWRVIGTCRNLDNAAEASAIADTNDSVDLYPLEVGDASAIDALAAQLKGTAIDLLVLNAGVLGADTASLGSLGQEAFDKVMSINTVTPALMIQAFRSHVAASDRKAIVAMSSILGSIAGNVDGGLYSYRASKAGLNAVLRSAAVDLKPDGSVVLAMHPGWVKTDMGGPGAMIDAQESISGMIKVIDSLEASDSGTFRTYDGGELPW